MVGGYSLWGETTGVFLVEKLSIKEINQDVWAPRDWEYSCHLHVPRGRIDYWMGKNGVAKVGKNRLILERRD